MTFNDTTNKNGIIQEVEFFTNLGDGTISGDSTLLKQITARVNAAFDTLMPRLLSFNSNLRWDDANNTDQPVGTTNIVSGQSDYTFTTDASSLDILNVSRIAILNSATATYYYDLEQVSIHDPKATHMMAPSPTDTGSPRYFLKRGNTIFLFPQPNYNATNGIRIFFERSPSYFASSDTIKVPGIPRPFHGLLPLYASLDWLLVNKPANTALITRLEARIQVKEKELDRAMKDLFPAKAVMTSRSIRYK